jgi:hypothetical protein
MCVSVGQQAVNVIDCLELDGAALSVGWDSNCVRTLGCAWFPPRTFTGNIFVDQDMSASIDSIILFDANTDARGDGTCGDASCVIYKSHLSYCEREWTGMTLKQRTMRG